MAISTTKTISQQRATEPLHNSFQLLEFEQQQKGKFHSNFFSWVNSNYSISSASMVEKNQVSDKERFLERGQGGSELVPLSGLPWLQTVTFTMKLKCKLKVTGLLSIKSPPVFSRFQKPLTGAIMPKKNNSYEYQRVFSWEKKHVECEWEVLQMSLKDINEWNFWIFLIYPTVFKKSENESERLEN